MGRPDIEGIKERCEKATPEPWENNLHHWGDTVVEWDLAHGRLRLEGDGGPGFDDDAEFIAHARSDIPALISYIEELERELYDDSQDEEAQEESDYYEGLLGH